MEAKHKPATPRTDWAISRTARLGTMSGMEFAWEDLGSFAKELEAEHAALAQALQALVRLDETCQQNATALSNAREALKKAGYL